MLLGFSQALLLHHANYCASISKISRILTAKISRLNGPPLPDSACSSRVSSRELDREKKVTSFTYEFNFSMCEPS